MRFSSVTESNCTRNTSRIRTARLTEAPLKGSLNHRDASHVASTVRGNLCPMGKQGRRSKLRVVLRTRWISPLRSISVPSGASSQSRRSWPLEQPHPEVLHAIIIAPGQHLIRWSSAHPTPVNVESTSSPDAKARSCDVARLDHPRHGEHEFVESDQSSQPTNHPTGEEALGRTRQEERQK